MNGQLFTNFILFQPNKEQIKVSNALAIALSHFNIHVNIHISRTLKDLEEQYQPLAIVILCKPTTNLLYQKSFDIGIFSIITYDQFIRLFFSYTSTHLVERSEQIFLSFLPKNISSILYGIFSLYGFKVHIINNLDNFAQNIQSANYIILDQDLLGLDSLNMNIISIRKKIMNIISIAQKENNSLAVSVIKDFLKGSLSDDIVSPVKSICNILLSPYEYIHFIIQFLELAIFQKDFESNMNIIDKLNLKNAMAFQSKRNLFKQLRDPKKVYYTIETNRSEINTYLDKYNNIAENFILLKQCKILIHWLEVYCSQLDEINNLPSFSSNGNDAMEPVLLKSLISTKHSTSFQSKNVSPQKRLKDPKSP